MEIIVKKPTEAEKADMRTEHVWECIVSEFDWYYDSEETCLVIEGEVTVEYDGRSVSFGAGDYITFPKGLSCVWKVTKPVRKYYVFK
ncbi:MAG: cupin domain-containing protein [Oscillospiraceae bacterium]|nr:cupin domain-containing protein [Oscillospiraceae bacterium]